VAAMGLRALIDEEWGGADPGLGLQVKFLENN